MKGKFLRDLSALWMGKPHLLIPYWSRSCVFSNQTAVYCTYFRWQSCLRQRPCHGLVLAVPRLRWMMYMCFPVVRQRADFVFKLSTEEQEGCKSCVVMVQAAEEPLCNHHLTVEILSAAAALLLVNHHSLLKLCYPQARAQLWILVGWLKHVASPHKTRVCDFIFLPSLEQLLNNSLGKKKKSARVSYRHLRTMLCSFGEPWKLSPCAAPRVKQAGDWVQAFVGSLQTSSSNGGSAEKPDWGWRTTLSSQAGERGVNPSACVTNVSALDTASGGGL